MRIARNFPVLVWWLICVTIVIKFPVAVCLMGLVFLAAVPFKKLFLPHVPSTDEEEIQPVLGVAKYSALQRMTAMTMIKSHLYFHRTERRETPSATKILDISPRRKL